MRPLETWVHQPLRRLGASTNAKSDGVKERGNAYHRRVYKLLASHRAVNMPEWEWLPEPWFKQLNTGGVRKERSPDGVLLNRATATALVIEVKLNWKDGRDYKLLTEYLPIVQCAFKLDAAWPLLITSCLRGYEHPPLLGLGQLDRAFTWQPGDPTPLMLVP